MKGTNHAWCSSVDWITQTQNHTIVSCISEVRIWLFLKTEKWIKMHQSKWIQTAKLVCLQKYFKKKTTSVTKVLYRNISFFAKMSKEKYILSENVYWIASFFVVSVCWGFFLFVFLVFFNNFPMVCEQKANNFFSPLKQKIDNFSF